jgi:predicted nuclease of predicted toxin-antitoxin system
LKILLDENMPLKLADPLRQLKHLVETVNSLRLIGIDNGVLYSLAAREYDLFFTKDGDFAKRARESRRQTKLKVLRVGLKQKPQNEFVRDFMEEFVKADWTRYSSGDEWP